MPQSLRLGLFLVPLLAVVVADHALGKSIFGWMERVKLMDADLVLEAKLDTGAETSSVHAPDPEVFDKDGDEWVRFRITNNDGDEHVYERPVERTVRIRSASGTTRRHVVKLAICLGNVKRESEVNLSDREEMSSEMLIGRNFLAGHVLVDADSEMSRDPTCDAEDDEDEGDSENDDSENE